MSDPGGLSAAAHGEPAPEPRALDRAVARDAAQWLARLHSGEATAADWAACQRWREQDREHERAWQKAEQLSRRLALVPAQAGQAVLGRARRGNRRAATKALALLVVGAPAGYMAWRGGWAPLDAASGTLAAWSAGHRTTTGEQRSLVLADGTRLLLNTATAVDVHDTAAERRVVLHQGEILVTTAPDPGRPFIVQTPHGRLRALGTRFVVRQASQGEAGAEGCRVTVIEGAVAVQPRGAETGSAARVIAAGQQVRFTSLAVDEATPADTHAQTWSQGVLFANDMRLGDFAAELGRYRRGVLRCEPAVAGLRITGAFQLHDTERILAALPDALPVRVVWRTGWWVTIAAPDS